MAATNYVDGQPKAVSKRNVLMTSHATQMLKSRGISQATVLKALSSGTSRIDSETGREVVRAGDLRLVVKRDGNTITVVTAVTDKDLSA
jgi:hypothetical protein